MKAFIMLIYGIISIMLTGLNSNSTLSVKDGIYGAANYHDGYGNCCSIVGIISSKVGTYGSELTNSFAISFNSE
jgi:hypothetical protein